jgi:hypothetical protein
MISRNATQHCTKRQRLHYRYWALAVLLIILLLTAGVRIRLLDVPLERDEGAYAYMAQLILQGIPPYAESHDVKMPGLYAVYALLLALFGQTQRGIHFGLLLVNAGTIVLLFLLAKKLLGNLAAVVTAAAFAILSLSQPVQGVFANAEHFVLLPAIGGFVLLLRAVKSDRLLTIFFSGILLGTAFIIKQPGAAFIACGGLYLLYSQLRVRPVIWPRCLLKCVLFSVGVALPFILSCLILWSAGVFHKFWFWTFVYPSEYVSSISLSMGLKILKIKILRIIKPAVFLWVLGGIGLTAIVWDKKARSQAVFVVMFLLLSFLSVCPGLYFRPHYFILLLPAVALLAGTAVNSTAQLFSKVGTTTLRKVVPALLVLVVVFQSVYKQRVFLFQLSPEQVSEMTYGANPFPESLRIADYIKQHSSADDSIAILGSEPQIYFYSRRRSATKYTTTYPITGNHKYARQMQEEMIRDIETAHPKFLLFVSAHTSWLAGPEAENLIFDWFEQYYPRYYTQVGIVDVWRHKPTIYRWGQDAVKYEPQSICWIAVFQKK